MKLKRFENHEAEKNPNPFKGLFMGETWTLLKVP